MIYKVRIKGVLSPERAEWFSGFDITPEEKGITLLTGRIIDQAALHGLFKKIRDSGITLISVISVSEEGMDHEEG